MMETPPKVTVKLTGFTTKSKAQKDLDSKLRHSPNVPERIIIDNSGTPERM